MNTLNYLAIAAQQSKQHRALTFAASASDVLRFAAIDRIARDDAGQVKGFQRPQIASHIREIETYLEADHAVLPNPIVIAFTDGIEVIDQGEGRCEVKIDIAGGPPGFVVDGQQRLSALSNLREKNFEVFVSALICPNEEELRRQFVLINNTRPLPKSLIYELLPTVDGLPPRLSARAKAAALTDKMNYTEDSVFRGLIKQHTNPRGVISDTAIQKVFMNSLSDGVMREYSRRPGGEEECYNLANEFFKAVTIAFEDDWWQDKRQQRLHTPRTSRLLHGAGLVALGHVLESLAFLDGSRRCEEFTHGLACLQGRTAWTKGHWDFGEGDIRLWNAIQNIDRDIRFLGRYLITIVKADIRQRRQPEPAKRVAGAR